MPAFRWRQRRAFRHRTAATGCPSTTGAPPAPASAVTWLTLGVPPLALPRRLWTKCCTRAWTWWCVPSHALRASVLTTASLHGPGLHFATPDALQQRDAQARAAGPYCGGLAGRHHHRHSVMIAKQRPLISSAPRAPFCAPPQQRQRAAAGPRRRHLAPARPHPPRHQSQRQRPLHQPPPARRQPLLRLAAA